MSDVNERKKRPCAVLTCHGERFELVHKFPMESDRTEQWLEALQIPHLFKVPLEKLRTSYFICSRHFRSQDYKNPISRHLNKTAVPSLFLRNMEKIRRKETTNEQSIEIVAGNGNCDNNMPTELVAYTGAKKRKRPVAEDMPLDTVRVSESLPSAQTKEKANILSNNFSTEERKNSIFLNLIEHIRGTSDGNLSRNTGQCPAQTLLNGSNLHNEELNDVGMETNFVEVSHPDYDEVLTLDNFWLRDHCKCSKCFDSQNNQRKYSLLDISLDVRPLQTDVRNKMLYVEWDDGHQSTYSFEYLYNSQYGALRQGSLIKQHLWEAKLMKQLSFRVQLGDLVSNDNAVLEVLRSLASFGFAFIDNVPPTKDMTEMAVRRLFPIQSTFFGDMWSLSAGHLDSAYTNNYLEPHTDNTYFNDAAGLQVLHCTKPADNGGETILVDGFKVVEDFKIKSPQAFKRLCKINVPAEYIENGQHHTYCAPVIKVNRLMDTVEQIRINAYDRSTFNTIPQAEMYDFYRDFRELVKLVNSDIYKWQFKLEAGTVLIVDNWRVLHGRQKYSGARQMTGCYVSRTDYLSKLRLAGLWL